MVKIYEAQVDASDCWAKYIAYYNDDDHIYLVNIDNYDNSDRYIRIEVKHKNKKNIYYEDIENMRTYTYGINNDRVIVESF